MQNWWGLQLPLQAFKTITQAVAQLFNNGAQCVQLLADTWSKEDLTEAHISMANIVSHSLLQALTGSQCGLSAWAAEDLCSLCVGLRDRQLIHKDDHFSFCLGTMCHSSLVPRAGYRDLNSTFMCTHDICTHHMSTHHMNTHHMCTHHMC